MVRKAIDALENQEAGNIYPSILVSVNCLFLTGPVSSFLLLPGVYIAEGETLLKLIPEQNFKSDLWINYNNITSIGNCLYYKASSNLWCIVFAELKMIYNIEKIIYWILLLAIVVVAHRRETLTVFNYRLSWSTVFDWYGPRFLKKMKY